MDKEIFWKIMEETNLKSGRKPVKQQRLIEKKLLELSSEDIIKFDDIYREYVYNAYDWKLWAAVTIINGGCSDDCFMDFRGWLVAQGHDIYYKAIADPDSLSEHDYMDGITDYEGFGYLAFTTYEKKTGKQMPSNPEISHPAEPTGEEWDEDELEKLLPELYKKHCGKQSFRQFVLGIFKNFREKVLRYVKILVPFV